MSKKKKIGDRRLCPCGDFFTIAKKAHYRCEIVKTSQCELCNERFDFTCKGGLRRFCTPRCQATFASRHENSVTVKKSDDFKKKVGLANKKALEEKYGPGVTNPSQIPQVREKRRVQMENLHSTGVMSQAIKARFGENVENVSQVKEINKRIADSNKITQATPETQLKTLKTAHPQIKNAEEWVSLDFGVWATRFREETGIKPRVSDLKEYFNLRSVKVPYEYKALFGTSDSSLELRFGAILEDHGLLLNEDYFRRRRFLVRKNGRRFELDFFIPSLRIAFEIQDFSTHSRVSDREPSYFKAKIIGTSTKKGPQYHDEKRSLAKEYGIDLYEVWEDEFGDLDSLFVTIGLTIFGDTIMGDAAGSFTGHHLNQEEKRDSLSSTKTIPEYLQAKEKGWWIQ